MGVHEVPQHWFANYADLYALAANSLNWNESYMELDFAKDPKVQPFVDSMAGQDRSRTG